MVIFLTVLYNLKSHASYDLQNSSTFNYHYLVSQFLKIITKQVVFGKAAVLAGGDIQISESIECKINLVSHMINNYVIYL